MLLIANHDLATGFCYTERWNKMNDSTKWTQVLEDVCIVTVQVFSLPRIWRMKGVRMCIVSIKYTRLTFDDTLLIINSHHHFFAPFVICYWRARQCKQCKYVCAGLFSMHDIQYGSRSWAFFPLKVMGKSKKWTNHFQGNWSHPFLSSSFSTIFCNFYTGILKEQVKYFSSK